ncbi:MAG: hypothetical protein ACXWFB_01735 [Nitrososphaeraceae archaeon]
MSTRAWIACHSGFAFPSINYVPLLISINFKEIFAKRYLLHAQLRTVKTILNNDKF